MAQKKNTDKLHELKIQVNDAEEKEFLSYVEQGKFKSQRTAFVHLLRFWVSKNTNGTEENKEEVENGNGLMDNGEAKLEEPLAVVDEEKTSDNDANKGDDVPPEPKETKKSSAGKKGGAAKGKQKKADVNSKRDETYNVDAVEQGDDAMEDEPVKEDPAKKSKRGKAMGKKAIPDTVPEEPKENGGEGEEGEAETKEPTKVGEGDVPETKKRKGKAEGSSQEPKTASRRGIKKQNSASSVAELIQEGAQEQEEQVAGGEGKARGKRKPAKEKMQEAAAAADQPETSGATAATKPKRGRAAKTIKNYQEADESY